MRWNIRDNLTLHCTFELNQLSSRIHDIYVFQV